jgi:DNA polymerase-1
VVPKDWKLVGCDADGLEARCMAHYMFKYDGGKMIDVILNGKKSDGTDFHSLNKGYLGFKSRDVAKTYFYGLIYGAGLAKSGLIAMEDDNYKHWKAKDAAKLGGITKALLMDKFPGFKDLTKAVQEAARRGWLKGLDGRKIPIRSLHSALNALFQSAGAVIMKKAMVIQDELIQEKGLVPGKDYDQVLFIHDEFQMEVIDKLNYTTIVGECMEKAIRLAGEHFKFKCPLSGSHDVGNNWSETH